MIKPGFFEFFLGIYSIYGLIMLVDHGLIMIKPSIVNRLIMIKPNDQAIDQSISI